MRRRLIVHTYLWTFLVVAWALLQAAAGAEARWEALHAGDFDPRGERVWFELEIGEAQPLRGGSGACSLGSRERLRLGRYLGEGGTGPGREASCVYHAVLPGHGPECLIEFPGATAESYEAVDLGARLAHRYYAESLGGLGLLTTGDAAGEPRVFLILDDRWCRWFGAGDGFRLR